MNFIDHAQAHGLLMRHAIPDAKWHRVPTVDKPRKRNGAYVFDGHRGAVRNWATMETFASWWDGNKSFLPQVFKPTDDAIRKQKAAAKLAQEMMNKAFVTTHNYLKCKGFPEAKGLVLDDELLIPMRDMETSELISLQRIKDDGNKRFLYGGRSKRGIFILNREHSRKEVWLCEGYATGLSIQAALKSLYRDAAVMVCFSAGNMVEVGRRLKSKFVVADHDASGTGQRCAEELSCRWGMSEREGEDANDLHQREGLAAVRALLLKVCK